MRRILLALTVGLVMAVIMAASALPVFAAAKFPEANCIGGIASGTHEEGNPELISQTAQDSTASTSGINAIATTNCSTRPGPGHYGP
jgi:hypothetical protein